MPNENNSTSNQFSSGSGFIDRIQIRNYKSIGNCDLSLGRVTMLVGRNGAGKSNFLDALRFIADSLDYSLDHAVKARGGIDQVRRRSTGHPRNFAIVLHVHMDNWGLAQYGFEIAARPRSQYYIKSERLNIISGNGSIQHHYTISDGNLVGASEDRMPPAAADRLYLVTASSLPVFRPVYDALRSVGFYNLNPDVMKELQSPDAGELLHRDGSNVASVIGRLQLDRPSVISRVERYLANITPGVEHVERVTLGPKETVQFRQAVVGAEHPWRFYGASMSDGTLRALGVLVAVSQLVGRANPVRLVGIEEPETALHPAAANALMDAVFEAAAETQVVITTHSPELLDAGGGTAVTPLIVVSDLGQTKIARIDEASRGAIEKHLYTAGELHIMDQLELDPVDVLRQDQLELFEGFEI